jgi:hypothetical protein
MRQLQGHAAVTVMLLAAAGLSDACASQAGQNPRPAVPTTTGGQPNSQKNDTVVTVDRRAVDPALRLHDDLNGEQAKHASAAAPEPSRSVEELRRCPDPYEGEGTGWLARTEPDEARVRELNGRHGLLCSERSEHVGCVDDKGRIAIPFVYSKVTYFAESGVALALLPDKGWVYIDTKNRTIGKAETLDGMPDEVFGGHARFRAVNGKIGYLDRNRRITIPAQYDGAMPFRNCTALVCVGCHPQRWDASTPEGAACTGKAFVIDESGARVEGASGTDWERCEEKDH